MALGLRLLLQLSDRLLIGFSQRFQLLLLLCQLVVLFLCDSFLLHHIQLFFYPCIVVLSQLRILPCGGTSHVVALDDISVQLFCTLVSELKSFLVDSRSFLIESNSLWSFTLSVFRVANSGPFTESFATSLVMDSSYASLVFENTGREYSSYLFLN